MNISGIVVQARPENTAGLQAQLTELSGVTVHAARPDGRMVITIEDTLEAVPAETLMQVQNLPGVLSATMIYNYCDE